MTQNGYPFEQQPTTEPQYEALASEWQDTGVVGSYGSSVLAVSAASTGMQVTVQPGAAIVRGTYFVSTAAEVLPIRDAATSPRIDLVLVRRDYVANTIALATKEGTPAASPAAPGLTQVAGGIWECELARVTVPANAVTIASGNITERRTWVGARTGAWTTATRPASPRRGQLGMNHTTGRWEYHDGSGWVDLIPSTVANAENAARVGGLEIIRSATTPTGTPSTNRIWIKPI